METIDIKIRKLTASTVAFSLLDRKRRLLEDIKAMAERTGRYGLKSTNGEWQWTDGMIEEQRSNTRTIIQLIEAALDDLKASGVEVPA